MAYNTIRDGTGEGYQARVDKTNRLRVRSVNLSTEAYENIVNGKAYSLYVSATPTGAGDCFFYFKNTSESSLYVIEGLQVYVASNESIEVYLKDTGTPSGGTAVSPVTLNTSSNEVLNATIEQGNNITGLTQGSMAYKLRVPANNSTNAYNFDQDIVISPQQTFCLYATSGGIAVEATLDCHIIIPEEDA